MTPYWSHCNLNIPVTFLALCSSVYFHCTVHLWNISYNLLTCNVHIYSYVINIHTFIYVSCRTTSAKPRCLLSGRSLEASLFSKISSFRSLQYATLVSGKRLILICVWRLCTNKFIFVWNIYTNDYWLCRVCLSVCPPSVLKEKIGSKWMCFLYIWFWRLFRYSS